VSFREKQSSATEKQSSAPDENAVNFG